MAWPYRLGLFHVVNGQIALIGDADGRAFKPLHDNRVNRSAGLRIGDFFNTENGDDVGVSCSGQEPLRALMALEIPEAAGLTILTATSRSRSSAAERRGCAAGRSR